METSGGLSFVFLGAFRRTVTRTGLEISDGLSDRPPE